MCYLKWIYDIHGWRIFASVFDLCAISTSFFDVSPLRTMFFFLSSRSFFFSVSSGGDARSHFGSLDLNSRKWGFFLLLENVSGARRELSTMELCIIWSSDHWSKNRLWAVVEKKNCNESVKKQKEKQHFDNDSSIKWKWSLVQQVYYAVCSVWYRQMCKEFIDSNRLDWISLCFFFSLIIIFKLSGGLGHCDARKWKSK